MRLCAYKFADNTQQQNNISEVIFMLIVGIDVAKYKHDIHIFNQSTGEIICQSKTIMNTKAGFSELLDIIGEPDKQLVHIGLESTGHYHLNLTHFLTDAGFHVDVINPIQTNRLRQTNVQKTKTDTIDARIIAKAVSMHLADVFVQHDVDTQNLQYFARYRFDIVQDMSQIKNKITSLIDQTFPEISSFFKSGIFGVNATNLLKQLPAAELIANKRVDALQNLLSQHYDAKALKLLASNSIGFFTHAIGFKIRSLFKQLEWLEKEKKAVESEIEKLIPDNSVLLSIPGISTALASLILGEIKDISLFDSSDKLLAFAGIDASIYQSGTFEASSSKMSKRGSKYLRYALMKAASLVARFDDNFNAYYTKKRLEGKHHLVAVSHCARKLVRILFKLLTENVPFVSHSS